MLKNEGLSIVSNFKKLLETLPILAQNSGLTDVYIYEKMSISKSKYYRFVKGKVIDLELINSFLKIVSR